jgi:hypothetical protein
MDLDSFADDKPVETPIPMKLPGRNKAVEKALDGMSTDLEDLNAKKMAAKESRGELEGRVTDSFAHMNDAMSLKHEMAKKESQLRVESGKLEVLEKDANRLDQTHGSLMSSLHRMLDGKIAKAKQRFLKKENMFRKEEGAAKLWKGKRDQLKAAAMELIAQKKTSHQALMDAEEEVTRAKKNAELARIKYERDRTKTAESVQSYRYAETRYQAEVQHENSAKESALAARASVANLFNVEHLEQEKVDQSIVVRRNRLRQKIERVEAAREKSTSELNALENKYRDWQRLQRARTVEVLKKSQETAAASEAYLGRQQQVLDTASQKVVQEAEAAGDWDGWGEMGAPFKVTDEDDD